ncbi:hypothetical protein LZ318_30740 [Saccharopolyspora indica]|uniref:hypothetical protein n=1 Tax=Saccharopolyspora indica TaxID=1229659 RepID=UPI0022EB5246|nr:hypothetical protein [Saccharopolyspora indica]MDA3644390.1 hypothetical protein [Saccharopolyspora indica]
MNHRTRMLTPDAYDTACDLAGDALLRRVPAAASVLQVTDDKVWSAFSAAVYITADSSNIIRYVGSTLRAGQVSDRIQEHVLAGRADLWIRLMVVPLHADTEEVLVRKIEGRIGLVLRPLDNVRLPSLGRDRAKLRVR